MIFCPFLNEVVPAEVCERWTTWIPHPGILGDAGPSSLSWAVLEGVPTWGLTMVRAEPAESAEQLGDLGWIDATPYNGAASTAFCKRLLGVLRYAAAQDTTAVALAGGRARAVVARDLATSAGGERESGRSSVG